MNTKMHINVSKVTILLYLYAMCRVGAVEQTVRIAFFTHMGGDLNNLGDGMFIAGAFFKALDEVNVDYPEFKFEYIFRDTNGLPWTALKQMADLFCNKTVSAFIGPDGYCASAALAATSFDLPYLTYGCHETIPDYNLAEVYNFVSTQPSPSKIAKFVMPLLEKFQWNSFTIISGEDLAWRGAAKELESQAISANVKVNNITYDQVMDLFYPGSEQSFVNILKDTMEKTRIYVLLGDYDAMVEFSRVMYAELGERRGEYVLIGVDNRGRVVDHYEYFIHSPIENFDTLKIDHLKAFRNVFILSLSHTDENWPAFVNETYRRNKEHPVYFSTPPTPVPEKIPILPLKVAYLYDAVKIYAKALNETYYTPNEDISNATHVISKLRDHSYKSIQGFNVYIDKRGDNDGNYTVLSIGPKKGQNINQMESVCEFRRSNYTIQVDCVENIDWLSGKPPLHEPECGFQGEKCNTNWQLAIIGSVLAAAVIVLLALGLVFKYYRYEKKLASLLWKIDRDELRFVDSVRDFYSPNRQRKKVYSPWKFILSGDNEGEKRASKKEKQKNTDAGSYRGTIVFIKQVKRRTLTINRDMKKQLQLRKELSHDNINRFIGACIELPDVYIVTAYCARGSLQDILRNEDSQLDDMFVSSLVADLIKGMIFIHDSNIISHGNLKTSNCLVDSRWVLQIADFGLPSVLSTTPPDEKDENYYEKLLWQAPELLRELNYNPHGTQKADVYAFAIILYELHGKKGPWGNTEKTANGIIESVKDMNDKTCYRPDLKELGCENYILSCIRDCWAEDPDFRPDFKTIRTRLKPMHQGLKANIFDNMLAMMEKYANNLEVLVAERTEQLSVEKKMTENLLLRMLPRYDKSPVAEQLKRGDPVIPEQYECVSIYFSDIVGFTALSAVSTPMQVIDMLNDLYSLFDCILEGYDVYKVETIGDAYVVVSGLPIRNNDNHAGEIASMALHLLSGLSTFRLRHQPDSSVKIRIGIHSGPCCAGVVGNKMPRYCLFGDTVNTASRMESTGAALKIHCSQECKAILDKLGGYKLEERGYVSLKGKGEKLTYFLTGEDKNHRIRRISTDKDSGSERRCVSSGNPDYSPQLNGYDSFVNAHTMPELSEIPEALKSSDGKKQISFQTVSPDDVRVHTQRLEDRNKITNAPKDTVLVVHETVSRDPSSSPREGSPQSDSTCSECEQSTFSIEDPNERKCLLKSKNAKQCHKVRKHNTMLEKPVHVCDDFSQTNGSVPESIL